MILTATTAKLEGAQMPNSPVALLLSVVAATLAAAATAAASDSIARASLTASLWLAGLAAIGLGVGLVVQLLS